MLVNRPQVVNDVITLSEFYLNFYCISSSASAGYAMAAHIVAIAYGLWHLQGAFCTIQPTWVTNLAVTHFDIEELVFNAEFQIAARRRFTEPRFFDDLIDRVECIASIVGKNLLDQPQRVLFNAFC